MHAVDGPATVLVGALRVLLISPYPHVDPRTGDVTYTENLLARPPSGVTYESHVDALAAGRLRERGRRSALTGVTGAGAVAEVAIIARERVLNGLRRRGLLFWEPFRYFEVVGSYDVVHVHTFSVRLTGKDVPLVMSNGARVGDLYRDARAWSARRTRWAQRTDLALARLTGVTHNIAVKTSAVRIVTFTDHLRAWYLERGADADVVVTVAAGVPRPVDRPVLTRDRPTRVGFVASDFLTKGGDVLCAAVADVVRARPDAEVVIAGSDAPPPGVTVPPEVTWLGRLTRDELNTTFYPSLDVFAYPTRFDGASLVLQEALSYGIPVAASDYGPIPEMTGDGRAGRASGVGDRRALADDIVRLLDPAENRRVATSCAAFFDEEYAEDAARGRLRAVYDSAAGPHP